MGLETMASLLVNAEQKKYAVGAFNIINIETLLGVIQAAEKFSSPIIIQIAESRLSVMPLEFIGPTMVLAAKQAKVPIAVNLDHATNIETINKALSLGFTSIMIDASMKKYDMNIKITKEIADIAHNNGASCEGELGSLAVNEDGEVDGVDLFTDPNKAEEFAKLSGIDALAISIGNQHGLVRKAVSLDFERLKKIHDLCNIPLVLHGGSGTSNEEFKTAIKYGVRKINVFSSTLDAVLKGTRNYFYNGGNNYFEYHQEIIKSARENAEKHIKIFGSKAI